MNKNVIRLKRFLHLSLFVISRNVST